MYANVDSHNDYIGKLKFFYYSTVNKFIPEIEENFQINASNWKKEPGSSLKFPHILSLSCPKLELELKTEFIDSLLNIKIYNRSKVKFELLNIRNNKLSKGIGWTEYWDVPSWMKGLLIKMNRSEQAKHVKNTQKMINN